jgi:hypothetical protein
VPEYWKPRCLFSIGRVGLEDFIWAWGTNDYWPADRGMLLGGRDGSSLANGRLFCFRFAISQLILR